VIARNPAVAAIVERFLTRIDSVVERSSEAIWDAVPSYGRSGRPLLEDVQSAVRDNAVTLARTLSETRDVRKEELEPIERVGARRAEAGIPLDDVLQAYRTVFRVCWDELARECREYKGEDVLEASLLLAEAVLRYTDQVSRAVADAYSRAQRAIVREQEGARREFLADLLYGATDILPEDMLSRAHTFGYDLSLSYVALVGAGPGKDSRKEALVSAAAGTLALGATADPIVLQRNEQTIALLPVEGPNELVPEKLVAELGQGWVFGMGGPALGLEGIRRAYLEAKEAVEIGLALGSEETVFRFDDLLLYHFLRVEPGLIDRFVAQMLGPLLDYDDRRKGELVRTLEAFFDSDGSVKLAGEALFAHPHTVTYRLKQIEKLTGWSLRNAEEKLRLHLALRAHRLAQARND
jgi:hypothetical protein